jgi:hypothetical protein
MSGPFLVELSGEVVMDTTDLSGGGVFWYI